MPRGRPRKNEANNTNAEDKLKPKKLPPTNEQVGEIKEKAKPPPPKKRGRKKKAQELLMKPEDVIDYMIRTYPKMQIDKIKDNVINGLKNRDTETERLYVLDEIIIGEDTYFCDPDGTVLNDDAQICGFVIDSDSDLTDLAEDCQDFDKRVDAVKSHQSGKTQDKKNVRVQMFYAQSDDRTFKQKIDAIENIKT